MPRKKFFVRPMQHALASQYSSIDLPYQMADWPTKNIKVNQHSIRNRWGYDTTHRDLGTGVNVQNVAIYQQKDGTRFTLYLTDTDLCAKETAADKTWSFKTPTDLYTGGAQVDSIDASTKLIVTFEGGATVSTDGAAAGDYFILYEDSSAGTVELDTSWRAIASVDSETQVTLSTAYEKAVTSPGAKNARIRKVYTTPTNERWTYAMLDDKFYFTNGNTHVQVWNGSNYATDLDSTNATKARYCIEYTNRLVIADCNSTRDPLMLKWSAINDPTDWTSSDAGQKQFLETEDYITGLGKVGNSLVVYKRESIIFGNKTGTATAPFIFPNHKMGVGCIAPYSILHFMGTNAFLGRDNFYLINGDEPIPAGGQIKDKFFEVVDETEAEHVWGFVNYKEHELVWVANSSEGQLAFVIDYETGEQAVYDFAHTLSGGGRGAL